MARRGLVLTSFVSFALLSLFVATNASWAAEGKAEERHDDSPTPAKRPDAPSEEVLKEQTKNFLLENFPVSEDDAGYFAERISANAENAGTDLGELMGSIYKATKTKLAEAARTKAKEGGDRKAFYERIAAAAEYDAANQTWSEEGKKLEEFEKFAAAYKKSREAKAVEAKKYKELVDKLSTETDATKRTAITDEIKKLGFDRTVLGNFALSNYAKTKGDDKFKNQAAAALDAGAVVGKENSLWFPVKDKDGKQQAIFVGAIDDARRSDTKNVGKFPVANWALQGLFSENSPINGLKIVPESEAFKLADIDAKNKWAPTKDGTGYKLEESSDALVSGLIQSRATAAAPPAKPTLTVFAAGTPKAKELETFLKGADNTCIQCHAASFNSARGTLTVKDKVRSPTKKSVQNHPDMKETFANLGALPAVIQEWFASLPEGK